MSECRLDIQSEHKLLVYNDTTFSYYIWCNQPYIKHLHRYDTCREPTSNTLRIPALSYNSEICMVL